MAFDTPVICVVGGAGVGKRSLVAAATATSPDHRFQRWGGGQYHLPWCISNRYYSANVTFRLHTIERSAVNGEVKVKPQTQPATQMGQPADFTAPTAQMEAEALLLVFDATQEASFRLVQAWVSAEQQLQQQMDNDDSTQPSLLSHAKIRVVVATKLDALQASGSPQAAVETGGDLLSMHPRQPARSRIHHVASTTGTVCAQPWLLEQEPSPWLEYPAWLNAAAEWCGEHMFDFIQTSALDSGLDQQLQLDGDLHGIRRVQDVLHAHVWPGHTPTAPPRSNAVALGISHDNVGEVVTSPADAVSVSLATTAMHAELVVDQEPTTAANIEHHQPLEAPKCTTPGASTALCAAAEAVQEAEVELYEKMLVDVQGARSRLGVLPDDARRREAALLAMRLAAMLDCGAGSDDSAGSDGSSDISNS